MEKKKKKGKDELKQEFEEEQNIDPNRPKKKKIVKNRAKDRHSPG